MRLCLFTSHVYACVSSNYLSCSSKTTSQFSQTIHSYLNPAKSEVPQMRGFSYLLHNWVHFPALSAPCRDATVSPRSYNELVLPSIADTKTTIFRILARANSHARLTKDPLKLQALIFSPLGKKIFSCPRFGGVSKSGCAHIDI